MPKRLAVNSRFRKLQVLEGCRVLLALAGRNRHVRCYSLDTVLYAVYAVFGLNWAMRKDKAYNVPSLKDLKSAEAATGDPPRQNSGSSATMASGPFAKAATVVETGGISGAAQANGANGLNLDTHYFKLPDTKESIEFDVYTTSAYIYIAVLTKDKITVWQRTKDPAMRGFTRVKVFWIPIEPVHMCLADDRTSLKHIVAVFSGDATIINLRDSKVKTITLDPALIALHRESWAQQQIHTATQGSSPGATATSGSHSPSPHSSHAPTLSGQSAPIPVPSISSSSSPGYAHYFNNSAFSSALLSLSPPSSLATSSGYTSQSLLSPPLNANSPFFTPSLPPSTTASANPFQIRPLQLPSRKETGPPPITWTSLIQLPFPPDLLPPESLTQDFTVPPAYTTVVGAPADGNHLHAPIPLTSSSPQLFLATLATRSYIIDIAGALYSTSTLQWGMVPLHVEFVRISAHNVSSVYVVGFGKSAVEVLDLRTGRCVQRAVRGVPVEYLGRWDEPGTGSAKEFKALFWCCFVKGAAYLYILKRTAEGEVAMSAAGW